MTRMMTRHDDGPRGLLSRNHPHAAPWGTGDGFSGGADGRTRHLWERGYFSESVGSFHWCISFWKIVIVIKKTQYYKIQQDESICIVRRNMNNIFVLDNVKRHEWIESSVFLNNKNGIVLVGMIGSKCPKLRSRQWSKLSRVSDRKVWSRPIDRSDRDPLIGLIMILWSIWSRPTDRSRFGGPGTRSSMPQLGRHRPAYARKSEVRRVIRAECLVGTTKFNKSNVTYLSLCTFTMHIVQFKNYENRSMFLRCICIFMGSWVGDSYGSSHSETAQVNLAHFDFYCINRKIKILCIPCN